jgi:hypothetical protein
MRPGDLNAGDLFSSGTKQYWVPRYQRRYDWPADKLHGLWRDIGALYTGANKGTHFLGIIIGNPEAVAGGMPSQRTEIIDGQQRITTLLLLLVAIFEHKNEILQIKIPAKTHPLYFLVHPTTKKATEHKVLELQSADGKELDDLIAGKWRKKCAQQKKSSVLCAYEYFRYCLWFGEESFGTIEPFEIPEAKTKGDLKLLEERPEKLWEKHLDPNVKISPLTPEACDKLEVDIHTRLNFLNILVEENKGDEPAVVIFDSINGKRLEFSQWDHTRSYFFRTIGDDKELFDEWDEAQDGFVEALKKSGQRKRRNNVPVNDEFLYNLLIVEAGFTGLRPNLNRSFTQLREYLRGKFNGKEPSSAELSQFSREVLLPTAVVYQSIISQNNFPLKSNTGDELPEQAKTCLKQIAAFSKGPADPAIMLCLVSWHNGFASDSELVASLRAIECFLARYFLEGNNLSPLRSKFMNMIASAAARTTSAEKRIAELVAEIKTQSPKDAAIFKAFEANIARPIYQTQAGGAQRAAAVLRGIEEELSGQAANPMPLGNGPKDFNVDHIFPQSCLKNLNVAWQEDAKAWGLSSNQVSELQSRMDALGNLALHAAYANKSDKDASFADKKLALAGKTKKKSVIVKHAQEICDQSVWTAKQIDERTRKLLGTALKHWEITS